MKQSKKTKISAYLARGYLVLAIIGLCMIGILLFDKYEKSMIIKKMESERITPLTSLMDCNQKIHEETHSVYQMLSGDYLKLQGDEFSKKSQKTQEAIEDYMGYLQGDEHREIKQSFRDYYEKYHFQLEKIVSDIAKGEYETAHIRLTSQSYKQSRQALMIFQKECR